MRTMTIAAREKAVDPRVSAAIAHWAPRFVTNGVALTDFEEVTASIASWNDWCRAWSARAAVHEEMGREALARKKFVSAGEHLQRAGVYYHFGKFLFVQDLAQMKAAHMKAVECRKLALPHLRPFGERVEMPYEGKWLADEVKIPVVLNLVEEGNHIANTRAYCWRTQSADWMAEQLGAG